MYKLIKSDFGNPITVQRLSDGTFIPLNAPDNTDYQAFLLWKSEGNEPLPADE